MFRFVERVGNIWYFATDFLSSYKIASLYQKGEIAKKYITYNVANDNFVVGILNPLQFNFQWGKWYTLVLDQYYNRDVYKEIFNCGKSDAADKLHAREMLDRLHTMSCVLHFNNGQNIAKIYKDKITENLEYDKISNLLDKKVKLENSILYKFCNGRIADEESDEESDEEPIIDEEYESDVDDALSDLTEIEEIEEGEDEDETNEE